MKKEVTRKYNPRRYLRTIDASAERVDWALSGKLFLLGPLTSSSLFESPNENFSTNNARCLMAHVTEVSSSTPKTMHDMNDQSSLVIKKELVAFDTFMTNLQGEAKEHVESLMRQLCAAEELLQEKSKIEREDSLTIVLVHTSPTRRTPLKRRNSGLHPCLRML